MNLPNLLPDMYLTPSTAHLVNPYDDELVNYSRLSAALHQPSRNEAPSRVYTISSSLIATSECIQDHEVEHIVGHPAEFITVTSGPPSYRNTPHLHREITNAVDLTYLAFLPLRQILLAVSYSAYAIGPWFYGYNDRRMGNFRVDGLYQNQAGIAILAISSCNIADEPATATHPRFLAVPYEFLSPRYQKMMRARPVDPAVWQQVPEALFDSLDTQAEAGKGTWWSAATTELIRMHED